MPPVSSFFAVNIARNVAHVRMNKPDKANSMTPDFWVDLPRIIGELGEDRAVRAVVLSGEGRHFTGGMDLATFADINALTEQEPGRAAFALRQLVMKLQNTFSALENTHLPVIAAIQGACLGGGIDMITACDIRLAATDAYFSIEEINIGMTADVGTLQRLPKLIAPGIVRELAMTGRRFSAAEALQWGLVNRTFDDHAATVAAALEMAGEIAAKSPLAIAGIKQTLNYARDHAVAEGLDQIATWNGGMLRREDLQEAITSRMAKKQGVFNDLVKAV